MTIDVREAGPGDEQGILELHRRAFGRAISVEHWRWKRELSFVAADGSRIVAHYGASPRRFWIDGREVIAAAGADAMTDPEYRRRGLFFQVTSLAQETMRARGVAFELGIPTSTWGSRVEALGWETLFPMQTLIRPLLLPPLPRALRAVPVLVADERFDELWSIHRDEFVASQIRDRAWVSWRYLASPDLKYRVLSTGEAWVALRIDGDIGYIVDELGSPAALRIAVSAAVEAMRGRGVRKAQVFVAQGSPRAHFYQRLGFLYPRDRLFASWRPYAAIASMDDPRRTLIRGGDFDFA